MMGPEGWPEVARVVRERRPPGPKGLVPGVVIYRQGKGLMAPKGGWTHPLLSGIGSRCGEEKAGSPRARVCARGSGDYRHIVSLP